MESGSKQAKESKKALFLPEETHSEAL